MSHFERAENLGALVVVGGVGSKKSDLERVVEAAVDLGIVIDGAAFTSRQARKNEKELACAIRKGGKVATHSAGVVLLPDYLEVKDAMFFAPPEKRSIPGLLVGAGVKTLHHLAGSTDLSRQQHLRVAANTTAYALRDVGMLPAIARFSTAERVAENRFVNPEVVHYYAMSHDAYFPDSVGYASPLIGDTSYVTELAGRRHDDLLVAPRQVLREALVI